jgi:REP element-mobilizing transposase RayT
MQPLPQRKSPRLQGYDYRQVGAYFVTICTVKRLALFGGIKDEMMNLSPLGQIAAEELASIPACWQSVYLDAFVVMPNHVHAIIVLDVPKVPDAKNGVPTSRPVGTAFMPSVAPSHTTPSLGTVVGAYKAGVTRRARSANLIDDDQPIWQVRYHDHIIRDETSLNRIRVYVEQNPVLWAEDTFYSVG